MAATLRMPLASSNSSWVWPKRSHSFFWDSRCAICFLVKAAKTPPSFRSHWMLYFLMRSRMMRPPSKAMSPISLAFLALVERSIESMSRL
ncbi:hypothetical protein D3C78_1484270 [compost metagenome]